jgi:hypothetical protein
VEWTIISLNPLMNNYYTVIIDVLQKLNEQI